MCIWVRVIGAHAAQPQGPYMILHDMPISTSTSDTHSFWSCRSTPRTCRMTSTRASSPSSTRTSRYSRRYGRQGWCGPGLSCREWVVDGKASVGGSVVLTCPGVLTCASCICTCAERSSSVALFKLQLNHCPFPPLCLSAIGAGHVQAAGAAGAREALSVAGGVEQGACHAAHGRTTRPALEGKRRSITFCHAP